METDSWFLPWPKPMTAMAGLGAMGHDDLVLARDKNVLRMLNMWDGSKDQEFTEVTYDLTPTNINN